MGMPETSGVDLLLVAFQALDPEEQGTALARLQEHYLYQSAEQDGVEGR
jgi:hypothetical protein